MGAHLYFDTGRDGYGPDQCGKTLTVGELISILEEYAGRDARIHYQVLPENGGIAENTNAALVMASGDYLVPVDHDDLVPENALYEFASAIRRDDVIDMLYSDEDKVSMDGRHFFEPHFKPDFDLSLIHISEPTRP